LNHNNLNLIYLYFLIKKSIQIQQLGYFDEYIETTTQLDLSLLYLFITRLTHG